METDGIAHVCYANAIPFISVRCITDTAGHSGNLKNCPLASQIAADLRMEITRSLSTG